MELHRIEAPAGGLNTEAAPDYLAKDQAPVLRNLIPHDGKVVMRGPVVASSATFGDGVDPTAFNPWVGSGSLLIQHPSTKVYRYFGGALTPIAVTSDKRIGQSSTSIGSKVYGINAEDDALLEWDGSTTITKLSNLPATSDLVAIRSHLQRLFLATSDTLYYSDPIDPTVPFTDNITTWQDDVSGLTNKILLPDSGSDPVVGLADVDAGLLVLRASSLLLLSGRTTSSFQIRTVFSETGCVSARSIVEYRDGCYFMSSRGIMWFDGMDAGLVPATNADLYGTVPAAVRIGRLEGDWLLVANGERAWIYHAPTGRWVEFTSDAMTPGVPLASSRVAGGGAVLFDGGRLFSTGYITQPPLINSGFRGFDRIDTSKYAIPAHWQSRLAKLPAGQKTLIKRVLVDGVWRFDSGTDDGWYVKIIDGTGSDLGAESRFPSGGANTARTRLQLDRYVETADAAVVVEWRASGTPPAVAVAEIHDCFIEHQPAQQRGNV